MTRHLWQRVFQQIHAIGVGIQVGCHAEQSRQVADRVERPRQKEHREDDEVHDRGEVVERLGERSHQHADAGAGVGGGDNAQHQ